MTQPTPDTAESSIKRWIHEVLDERAAKAEAERKKAADEAAAAKGKGILSSLFGE